MKDGGLPLVTIGAPVRNREWILLAYLWRLYNLEYPRDRLNLVFLINDSKDRSAEILVNFKRRHQHEYRSIRLLEYDVNQIEDRRIVSVRDSIFSSLAVLRNIVLSQIGDADYFFSVDTDVLVPAEALRKLLAHKSDIVSGQIWNDTTKSYPNILVDKGGRIVHWVNPPADSLVACDVTGAVYLLTRQVCKDVRYGYHFQGEDVPFCLDAKAMGYKIYCDTGLKCEHIYDPKWLAEVAGEAENWAVYGQPVEIQPGEIVPVPPEVVEEARIGAQNAYREPPTTHFLTIGLKANGRAFVQSQGDPYTLEGLHRIGRRFLDQVWEKGISTPPVFSSGER